MSSSLTRLVPLAPDSVVMNSIRNAGGDSADFPPFGVTLGMKDILAARRVRMYCPGGAWQRYVLRVACLGVPDADYPATLLQSHPDTVLVADESTAAPPEMSL
jgi:glucosamine-6-phosphate deaminase